MCGRYSAHLPPAAMQQAFDIAKPLPNFGPRYNLAPTQAAPVVRLDPDGERELALLRWGLVPFWAKDLAIGNKLINARAEGVAEKPAFRDAFRARRCLVPADGFYEWKKAGKGKQPYRIAMAGGGLFAFAGLWDRWRSKDGSGEAVETFAIITGQPNDLVAPIHDRMPVIIDPADYDAWLGGPRELAAELLRPYPADRMTAYPVSPRVNSPKNDDPEVIAPAEGDLLG